MAGIAIALGVAQLAGAGMSFYQASQEKKKIKEAEKEADKYMAEARKSLEVNFKKSIAIQKKPYELKREAALASGAQATEALRESDRGMGRVGAVYGLQQENQRKIAAAMGQEMYNLDYLVAEEDSRLRDAGTNMDLAEVTGSQLAAADAEVRRSQQIQQGVEGVTGAFTTAAKAKPLYKGEDNQFSNISPEEVTSMTTAADASASRTAPTVTTPPNNSSVFPPGYGNSGRDIGRNIQQPTPNGFSIDPFAPMTSYPNYVQNYR